MKKRGLLIVLGSLCLVFMLAAPSVAQVIKLTLADQNPQTGWGPMNALVPWVKKVEDATKGRGEDRNLSCSRPWSRDRISGMP